MNEIFKGIVQRVRQAVVTLLMVAAGARLAWDWIVPLVPILVCIVVVGIVLWVALGGWISGGK